jgi:hypothetical protein
MKNLRVRVKINIQNNGMEILFEVANRIQLARLARNMAK